MAFSARQFAHFLFSRVQPCCEELVSINILISVQAGGSQRTMNLLFGFVNAAYASSTPSLESSSAASTFDRRLTLEAWIIGDGVFDLLALYGFFDRATLALLGQTRWGLTSFLFWSVFAKQVRLPQA